MHTQKFNVLVDSLRRLLRRNATTTILNMTNKVHLADIAHTFIHLHQRERKTLFDIVYQSNFENACSILDYLDQDVALEILQEMEPAEASRLLENLDPEAVAGILSDLPEEISNEILELMKDKESVQVEEHLGYAEETAGRIMHTHFFAVKEEMTVKEAIAALQETGEELEMVFYLYVVDERGHLVGVISLRQLLIVKPVTRLADMMITDVVRVSTYTDQEEVARLTAKYDLLAIPVVDDENKLVGIVTVDDVIDIFREEATEDFFRLAGTSEEELTQQASSLRIVRLRTPWLFASLIGGLFSGKILQHYLTSTAGDVVALASFVPIIMGMGGNAGTQSSTIAVRSLALGRISFKSLASVLWKEFRIGITMGAICGTMIGAVAYLWYGKIYLGPVVGLSMLGAIIVATFIGTLMPMVFKRMKIDPAMASGPIVTTVIDITGLLIYFLLAAVLVSSFKQ
ncbi:magnesium transporter [Acidobacteriota bacterium]